MVPTTPHTRYLDPEALARLRNLGLAARLVVEGLFSGQHRSPRRGFSVEFAEHREYTPGVDPRHIDWKLLGRRDRLYVKQYEEQTNLRGYILMDTSASMGYRHGGAITKHEYACFCAASLAQLMQSQHDAFGLVSFAEQIDHFVPPRQGRGHLRAIFETLEATQPAGRTNLVRTLHELADRLNRRALVVLLSDLFGDGDDGPAGAQELVDAIGHFRHRKHEVIVLQILDPAELEFPFRDAGQIQDIETDHLVAADAEAIRRHYLEQVTAYIEALRRGCLSRRMSFETANTREPFSDFLARFLSHRSAMHAASA